MNVTEFRVYNQDGHIYVQLLDGATVVDTIEFTVTQDAVNFAQLVLEACQENNGLHSL